MTKSPGWREEKAGQRNISLTFQLVTPHLKNLAQAGSLSMIVGLVGMGWGVTEEERWKTKSQIYCLGMSGTENPSHLIWKRT